MISVVRFLRLLCIGGLTAASVWVGSAHAQSASSSAASTSSVGSSASTSSARPRPDPTIPPAGYRRCEAGTCGFPGMSEVLIRYCSSNPYEPYCSAATKIETQDFSCMPAVFGMPKASESWSDMTACFIRSEQFISAVATASTQSGSTRAPSFAVDGSYDTRWEASNSSPGTWFQLTFPSAVKVGLLNVTEYGERILGYRLEYRQGTQWTTHWYGTGIGNTGFQMDVVADAVRLVLFDQSKGQPSISEAYARTSTVPEVTTVSSTIVVAAGQTFDGGGKSFVPGGTLTGPMFDLGKGATLKNLNLDVLKALDAVVVTRGDATLEGVQWRTVRGGHALSMLAAGKLTVRNSVVGDVRAPLFRVMGASTVLLDGVRSYGSPGVVTQASGDTKAVKLQLNSSTFANAAYVFRTDSASSSVAATYGNICSVPSRYVGLTAAQISESNVGMHCANTY
ncbi:MAG: pectate lyase [Rhodocyclaceae bacterium]